MKILDIRWFCEGLGGCGIARIEDECDGIQYRIGARQGMSEEFDKWSIADWGSSFPKDVGDVLFGVE